ncbi:hypothetical protein [Mammaliicoccus sp. Dog046]|uniref:hypothetical protein n=1 Tax=Mammaliicoccus sp. Dog046 TaxID=3034233 RepID=UPI002B263D1D|nr:hypothetical protein [Mammaliicoccus sp. Dog046]WQK86198.1 hypothetical protein P3U32_03940 [Mammaliicoccus sp. Dog046]
MYIEGNVLISPKLDYYSTDLLKRFSQGKPVPSDQEIKALIELIEDEQPFLKSITIGTSNEIEMINIAFTLKNYLERMWFESKNEEIYINIVVWKNHVGSSKKYVKQFMSYAPDAWIVLGSQIGFCNVIKRLYRLNDWDSERTYCMSTLLSQAMMNIVGNKYFEGVNGVTYHGDTWKVENGIIAIKR